MTTLDLKQIVAANVRQAIADRGISESEAAARAGIPKATFNRSTNGRRPFTVEELESIATALGLTDAGALLTSTPSALALTASSAETVEVAA